MQVCVKLFGTLSNKWSDYNHESGLTVELPEGANIKDLIETLALDYSRVGMACINNHKVKPEDILQAGAVVSIFQPICGG